MKLLWASIVSIVVALVVVETVVVLRIDLTRNAQTIRDSFSTAIPLAPAVPRDKCEQFLEERDRLPYLRDFNKDPIRVEFSETKGTEDCAVKCHFAMRFPSKTKVDAVFGFHGDPDVGKVARTMESTQYYAEFELATARSRGYTVVMTTSLSSDVPVGYFSWAEYDLMAPVEEKTERSLAAAFISNCGGHTFRLEAVSRFQKLGVPVDSYGTCLRNVDRHAVEKVKALRRYKFSLAFENSNEEDYVTEKFWQSLVAGSVPVVIGAPNIQDFAPAPNSVIQLKTVQDIEPAANLIKYLANNATAYNETLRWKLEGPSDSFKALVDMAAVHSSCRLCIHLATGIHRKELENATRSRPCKCTEGSITTYHLYVRERGRFYMESVFLRSSDLSMDALEAAIIEKFSSKKHAPVWNDARPGVLKWKNELKVYRVYPLHLTQRQALYSWQFTNESLKNYVEVNPCAELEVIFV